MGCHCTGFLSKFLFKNPFDFDYRSTVISRSRLKIRWLYKPVFTVTLECCFFSLDGESFRLCQIFLYSQILVVLPFLTKSRNCSFFVAFQKFCNLRFVQNWSLSGQNLGRLQIDFLFVANVFGIYVHIVISSNTLGRLYYLWELTLLIKKYAKLYQITLIL